LTGYRILTEAGKDLKAIWRDTEGKRGAQQADIYTDALKKRCSMIAEYPEGWAEVTLGRNKVRVSYCQHHYIVYMIEQGEVWILAFLHEKMDFMTRLKERFKSTLSS
jgi:toxin ParE1/3/4